MTKPSLLLFLLAIYIASLSLTTGFTVPGGAGVRLRNPVSPLLVSKGFQQDYTETEEANCKPKELEATSGYDPSVDFEVSDPPKVSTDEESGVNNELIRDLDGNPLGCNYFVDKMDLKPTDRVDKYVCPTKDAFRGFMSNACRVHLLPCDKTAFYKSIVFEELDHSHQKLKTAPFKLTRDIRSYQVVANWLSSAACQQLCQHTEVFIPKCYDVQSLPNYQKPIESKFSFLLEDYTPWDGWYQQWLLIEEEECKAALKTYAQIHAFFWHGSNFWSNPNNREAQQELEQAIWESGSYVQPKQQYNSDTDTASKKNQCQMLEKEWKIKRQKFAKELSRMEYWDNLGERLQTVAEQMGTLAHPFANQGRRQTQQEHETHKNRYQQYRTFTHGDPKQANLFFRRHKKDNDGLDVGLIDFQWSGFGLAATDIAHFLTSSIHADRLVEGGEEQLLQYYYQELSKYLVEYGAYASAEEVHERYPYTTVFQKQYEIGVLDICRLMIAYTWSRFTEPVEKDDELGMARTLNKTSYNKSVPNIVWLLTKCHTILQTRFGI